jgi:hypothetical protein
MLRHGLTPEEKRRVRLVEHFQPPIGTFNGYRDGGCDAATATRSHAADASDETMEGLGII